MYLVKIGNFHIKTSKNPFVHSYKSGVFTFFNFVVFSNSRFPFRSVGLK